MTSPVFVISVSSIAFSRSRRISTLVRRSTKRSRQALVQRVRQPVLNCTRRVLPMLRVGEPIRAVGNESPGPDMRDAVGERVDVAVGAVGLGHLRANQSVGIVTLAHQESIEGHDQFGVRRRRNLAVVGNLADVPQPLDGSRDCAPCRARPRRARRCSSTSMSSPIGARVSPCSLRRRRERCLQRAERGEIERRNCAIAACAPARSCGSSAPAPDRLERIAAAGRAERAVAHVRGRRGRRSGRARQALSLRN